VEPESFDRLFNAALVLLEHKALIVSASAHEVLASLFKASSHLLRAQHQLVWASLQRLLAQEHSQGLAYAIWLRWVFCENAELHFFFERPYWDFLRQGLQYGDSERRKQCLAILKQSVAIAASDESSIAKICSSEDGITGMWQKPCFNMIPMRTPAYTWHVVASKLRAPQSRSLVHWSIR